VLHAVTENVMLEIQKTFDFFKASASTDQIDRIMLSGGASRVDGFREWCRSGSTHRSRSSIRSAR
jgi:Tfp pilus assembly PilM family ATPase